MTHAHGGTLVVLVALFAGLLVGQIAQSTLARPIWLRASSRALAPRESAKLALALLALPLGTGVAAVAATLVVPLAALVDSTRDHCEIFPLAPHVCFVHGTWRVHGVVEIVAIAVLLVVVLSAVAREVRALVTAHRRARALLIGMDGEAARCAIVEADARFAFAVGVAHPRIVVSRGLVDALAPDELAAAIAHERAHIVRQHGRARVLARVVGAFVVDAGTRRSLMRDFVHAQEREADDDAALEVGSRALVAEALLAVLRRGHPHVPLGVPAFGGADAAARVEALCRPPDEGRVSRALALAGICFCVVVVGLHSAIHDAAESTAGRLVDVPVHSHVHPR